MMPRNSGRAMTELDNIRHWAGDKRGVYEVWYLTWNHPATDQGYWLRYLTEAPSEGPPRAELWFARFDPDRPDKTFGIHKHVPWSELASTAEPFSITIAGGTLGHDRAVGQLSGDGHDIRWDLRWEPASHGLRLLPDVMYGGDGRAETIVQSPNPRVPMSGTLVVDGESLTFDRAVLGQTHVFGKKHAYSWTWGRCAELGAEGALLELLGVRLQRRGITTPPMVLVTLDLDGEHHRFNQFRHVALNRGTWSGSSVMFSAWSPTVKLAGELSCRPSDMVSAPYLDPDGTHVFCANTEIGDARLTVWKRSGLRWLEHRRLEGNRRAHFEIGGRVRDPAVVREHVLAR
ncbi:MAG: uncharacterized protein JWO36_4795 [Myxococcales bacterium]|nr:uncharacterized protein [Myxococcales bacterium]